MSTLAVDDGRSALRTLALFRAALGLAMSAMLFLSWPLWVDSDSFPRVPFLANLPVLPRAVSWVAFGLLLASIALSVTGRFWRAATGVSLVLLVLLVVQDQERLQPWAYQYLVTGLLLAALPPARALTYARWWLVALYLHSGLSKLDVSFCREMGPLLLGTALRPFGVDSQNWPPGVKTAMILAMPAWEIVVAAALLVPSTRRIGLAGSLALHGALLGILGPWGMRQSPIVLVWNAAMMVEAVILFGPRCVEPPEPARSVSWPGRLAEGLFWIAAILPLGERWGVLDAWPAHALYASHVERTAIDVDETDVAELPAQVRRHLVALDDGPWMRLDLTGWSREVRGVPVYPQARACNGLAEALAARYGGRLLIRLTQWSRADHWTGRRVREECLGLPAIRRQGDRYRLNAHPAGAFLRDSDPRNERRPAPSGG